VDSSSIGEQGAPGWDSNEHDNVVDVCKAAVLLSVGQDEEGKTVVGRCSCSFSGAIGESDGASSFPALSATWDDDISERGNGPSAGAKDVGRGLSNGPEEFSPTTPAQGTSAAGVSPGNEHPRGSEYAPPADSDDP
jgi:hypothetical protein